MVLSVIMKNDRGHPGVTKMFYRFDSQLVLGQGHTKDFKNDSVLCLHGTQHEVGTTRPLGVCGGGSW